MFLLCCMHITFGNDCLCVWCNDNWVTSHINIRTDIIYVQLFDISRSSIYSPLWFPFVLINSSWLNYIITAIAISISRCQGVNPEVRKSLGISPLAAMLVSLFLIFSSLAYIDAKGWVKIIINVFRSLNHHKYQYGFQ